MFDSTLKYCQTYGLSSLKCNEILPDFSKAAVLFSLIFSIWLSACDAEEMDWKFRALILG